MCSDSFQSILRLKTNDSVKNFHHIITTIIHEMQRNTPTLLSLLKSCLKTRKPRPNTDVFLAVIMCIICKNRRPAACIIQRVFSLLLYTGQVSSGYLCITKKTHILPHCFINSTLGFSANAEGWSLYISLKDHQTCSPAW